MDCIVSLFVEQDWHDRLMRLARSEVQRLIAQSVIVDRDDAIQFAITETWIVVSKLQARPRGNFWGWVRYTMRRRLINEYIVRNMAHKRGGHGFYQSGHTENGRVGRIDGAQLEPAVRHITQTAYEPGSRFVVPHPELLTEPWTSVEDKIAAQQLAARVIARRPALAHKATSRQHAHQQRSIFAGVAKHVLTRRFDTNEGNDNER